MGKRTQYFFTHSAVLLINYKRNRIMIMNSDEKRITLNSDLVSLSGIYISGSFLEVFTINVVEGYSNHHLSVRVLTELSQETKS